MTAEYIIELKDRFSNPLNQLDSKMDMIERSLSGIQLTLQKGFSGGFKKFSGDGQRAAKDVINSIKPVKSEFSGLKDIIAGTFVGSALASGGLSLFNTLKDLPGEAIKTAREFNNMRDAIAFASGPDARKNLEFLDYEVGRLGLDVESTYKGFKTFQGALMGTALEGDKGRQIFEAVAEASSVMKLSAEQTEGTFLALGQMISKGNVQAEELRGQLGERLPGAFQIFARALGVSTSKLGDMLKNGEVMAADALPKFAAELKKTFSPGVLSAQDSFNANMNRFNNFLHDAKVGFGEGLIPYVNEFIALIPKLDFSGFISDLKEVASTVDGIFTSFSNLFSLFSDSFTTLDALNAYFRYGATVMRAIWTPIRLGAAAFASFVDVLKGSIPTISGVGQIIAGIVTRDWDMVISGNKKFNEGAGSFSSALARQSEFIANEEKGYSDIWNPGKKDNTPNTFSKNAGVNPRGFGVDGGRSGRGVSATDSGKAAGVEKVASGTKNITINISNLVKDITFQRYDGGSEAKMVDYIKKALVTAVNDVNIVSQ